MRLGPLLALPFLSAAALAQSPVAAADSARADSVAAALGGTPVLHAVFARAQRSDVLPVRSVREVAALVPGLRRDLATGALVFRSRMDREPVFVVDGVRRLGGPLGSNDVALLGALEVPFDAVERVGVWAGFVPASVGEAGGGVVEVATADGARALPASSPAGFGARVEGLSSEATDAYGTSLASATVRGPLGRLGGVSLTGEVRRLADAVPSAGASFRLSDDAYAALQASPQAVRVQDADGTVRTVPFPAAAAQSAVDAGRTFGPDDLRAALGLPAGTEVASPFPVLASQTFGADGFERAQDNPLRDLSLSGQAVVRPVDALQVRLGGVVQRRHASATSTTPALAFARRLYDREGLSEQAVDGASVFAGVDRLDLPGGLVARLRASYEATTSVFHPSTFSADVADALLYGDADAAANAVAGRYFSYFDGAYTQTFASDGGAFPTRAITGFVLPGAPATVYDRQSASSAQAAGGLRGRFGGHDVEVGGEAEAQTFRRFTLDGRFLAAYAADGSAEVAPQGFPNGVARYDQLDFETLRGVVSVYGYTFDGLDETTDEDVDGYVARTDTDVAPFSPVTAAGYVRDRFQVGPAAFDLGLRLETYDARATTLFDPYALYPVVRAGSLPSAPSSVGDDFAVYFRGGFSEAPVVGFRDRDGQFYDAAGLPTTAEEVVQQGQVDVTANTGAEAFTQTEASVRLQPRLGVRVQASTAVAVTGYAVRLSRRPDPSLYVPFTVYENLAGFNHVAGSAGLQPETVDAAGLGVEAAVTPRLRLGAAAFGRRHRGVPVVRTFVGGFPAYTGVDDTGRRDEAGLDLTLDLARTRGVAVRAAYTFAFARASDADARQSAFVFAPTSAPADADTRHALDVTADLRVPAGAGPRVGGVAPFGGLGVGIVFSAQSGLPYTATEENTGFTVFDSFTTDIRGEVNGTRLPWTRELDIRVERRFAVGPGALTAFVWAENVLGTRNTLAVYRSTRLPDADGFPGTQAGQAALSAPGAQAGYEAFTGGPVNVGGLQSTGAPYVYGRPRLVRLGVVLGL